MSFAGLALSLCFFSLSRHFSPYFNQQKMLWIFLCLVWEIFKNRELFVYSLMYGLEQLNSYFTVPIFSFECKKLNEHIEKNSKKKKKIFFTSILFFICSGKCSLEGPLDRCRGSSGGGGEKWEGRGGPGPRPLGESYPAVGGGRRRVDWPLNCLINRTVCVFKVSKRNPFFLIKHEFQINVYSF